MVAFRRHAQRTVAKLGQMLSDDPLRHPLGRASDRAINKALAVRKLRRADLFDRKKPIAPHRHRLAEMLTVFHFSTRDIVARHWSDLKLADHRCAYCANKKRCDRWLRGRHWDDAPRRFCPNVTMFERWRRDYLLRDGAGQNIDGDCILAAGLEQTRQLLRQCDWQDRHGDPTVFPASPASHTVAPGEDVS